MGICRPRSKSAVLFGLALSFPAAAVAARLTVTLAACQPLGADQLGGRLLIELAGRPVSDSAQVRVTCRAESIRVCVGDGDGTRCRELARAGLPLRGSAPILAVTAAELIEDLATETPATVVAVAAVAVPAARPSRADPPRPAGPSESRITINAVAAWQGFSGSAPWLAGGGLEVAGDHARRLGWSVDLLGRRGEAQFSLGTIAVLSLDAGAFVHVHHTISGLVLRAGVGVRGGAVALLGTAADPQVAAAQSLWAPWVAVAGKISVGVLLSKRLVFEASGEGGYVVHAVTGRADGLPAVQLAGFQVGVRSGLGVIF